MAFQLVLDRDMKAEPLKHPDGALVLGFDHGEKANYAVGGTKMLNHHLRGVTPTPMPAGEYVGDPCRPVAVNRRLHIPTIAQAWTWVRSHSASSFQAAGGIDRLKNPKCPMFASPSCAGTRCVRSIRATG